jgi:hypothetical protein
MKLNLGCGNHKVEGFVNVDAAPECAPDQLVDLEAFPWPWPDDSVEAALFHHSLEHMGADARVFVGVMTELYRVCAPDAVVRVVAPHPRHDSFLGDPTHVRPILPQMFQLFDRRLNEKWKATAAANTPLAIYAGLDFETTSVRHVLEEPYAGQFDRKELTGDDVAWLMRTHNTWCARCR